ncbi:MAG: EamA family transporter [archaeon]|nr:EamA family transporter [archaeon]
MWMIFAVGSALFAGLTSILAKIGVRNTDSNLATAVRTVVVLVFAWMMVAVTGTWAGIYDIDTESLVFLVLSGLSTGASWLCYFHALKIGDVNKVVPIDKSSTFLTIILAFVLLGESVTGVMAIGVVIMMVGTFMMIERKDAASLSDRRKSWLFFALGSAVFATSQALLAKVGITDIDSNLGTAIRTIVVLIMAWVVVAVSGKSGKVRDIDRRDLRFIVLSGVATVAAWLCFYRALQEGPASLVIPIDKLSILVTVAFSCLVLKERLSKKAFAGLVAITVGTLLMVVS